MVNFTIASAPVASIIPSIAVFAPFYGSLLKAIWWTSFACTKPANAIFRTPASIAILQNCERAFELIEN
jgi:hypothetical protein